MANRAVPTVVFATLLAVASPSVAQIALPIHIFPVMAKLSGQAGTDWVSSASISNISDFEVTATALFFEEDQNNIPLLGPSHDFTLAPGTTTTVDDLLGSWFPSQGNTKGFLVVFGESDGGDDDPFMLTAAGRIFNNANPLATYGQTIPSSVLGLVVAPGVAGLPGARNDDAVRSNVGVVNLSILPIAVIITTYGSDGSVVASVQKNVKTFSLGQWSMSQLGVPSLSSPGRVEVQIDPDTITWDPCIGEDPDIDDLQGIFLAYISRVDQVTGDAEFVLAQNDWSSYLTLCGEQPTAIPVERLFSR